jgi:hypothetical protein
MAKDTKQRQAAKEFVKEWLDKGYEKGETQRFWISLLHNVFGIDDPTRMMEFEIPVKTITKEKGSDFIDAYIPSTKVLIEQKGSHVDLSVKARQSDGSYLTPYQQGRRYAAGLPVSLSPRWIVACNFSTFEVHDMERPNDAPEIIQLADLEKEYHRLSFLIDNTTVHLKKELEVSIQAGEIVGVLYEKFREQYRDPDNPDSQKALNKLCVRLVFCLYAEDAGIFGSKNMFHDYMEQFSASEFREKLIKLFEIFDTRLEDRDPYLDERLLAFPYVSGGMFAGEIEIPRITDEIRSLILQRASDDFDWSLISPTIFGAVFESTLNPETRRAGGMHYTSIENIHKVIDPLFLGELKEELESIKAEKVVKTQRAKAIAFQDKLAGLKFLDPACGSGNFLTESYTSLRRLENEAIRIIYGGNRIIGELNDPIKVSINQFYGIEINDFACAVTQTALWIAETQMMAETDEIVGYDLEPLPLKNYNNILEGNALRMDWRFWPIVEDIPTIIAGKTYLYPSQEAGAPKLQEPVLRYENIDLYTEEIELRRTQREQRFYKVDFDYIMGNPPFLGARVMSSEQKDDLKEVFGAKWKNIGNMDYVTGWYKKASDVMTQTLHPVKAAFVSTNSITQGEQVANLWGPLMSQGIVINFAWRTFIWDSEASDKAHVHCVIIGFSTKETQIKRIFDKEKIVTASNINAYLVDAPSVAIDNSSKPICPVAEMVFGSMPNDGGFLSDYSREDKARIIKDYPQAEPLFHRFLGATEFINGGERWCLWLKDVSPVQYLHIPPIMDAINGVQKMRSESSRDSTRKLADVPMLFGEIRQPQGNYLLIPRHSSQSRNYIPIGVISGEIICGDANLLVPDASVYQFGVMTSSVHMAWVKTVCGRIKSDYRYSIKTVYNNFPWPNPTDEEIKKIEETAQAILDARANHSDASLADMYGNLVLFPDLMKAHRTNDAAVLEAYGFPKDANESEIVARLFKMYQELTSK